MRIKPWTVNLAAGFLWASIAANPVRRTLEWTHLGSISAFGQELGIPIDLTLVLTGFLIWAVARGRNWARITFLLCFLVGLYPFLRALRNDLAQPIIAAIEIAGVVLQTAGLLLLFTEPGCREWFHPEPPESTVEEPQHP